MSTQNDKEYVNLDHARKEHQIEIMKRIVADGLCPFCRENLMQYHTNPILFENEHWILTENFAPYDGTRKHYLIIAQKHSVTPWELTEEAQKNLFEIMQNVWAQDDMKGATLVMRYGDTEYTSATVTHLHAQIIVGASRTEGEGKILTGLGYKLKRSE